MAEKKLKSKTKYEYNVGEEVFYINNLYEKYKGKECVILSRSRTKKNDKILEWYDVKFICDEYEMMTLAGSLKRKEEICES